jgi:hypothetical protein
MSRHGKPRLSIRKKKRFQEEVYSYSRRLSIHFGEEWREFNDHLPRGQIMQILAHKVRRGKSLQNAILRTGRVLFEEKRARVYHADFMNEFFRSNPFLILKGNENDLVDVPNCPIDDLFRSWGRTKLSYGHSIRSAPRIRVF